MMIQKEKVGMIAKVFFVLFTMMFITVACSEDTPEEEVTFEVLKTYIPGTWNEGTEFFRFDADGNGETWDKSEDIHEGEGTKLVWILEDEQTFVIRYNDEIVRTTAIVPKSFTVTKLTKTEFVFGTHSLKKVQE